MGKNEDPKQWVWISNSHSGYEVYEDPDGATLGRGTRISLHLKDDTAEFLDQDKLEGLAQKYSQFINFPIYLWSSKEIDVEVPIEDDEEEKKEDAPKEDEGAEKEDEEKESEDDEDTKVEDVDDEDEGKEDDKPKTKTIKETKWDWRLVNDEKPIWTRKPKDVDEEDYNKFYKTITKDYQDPLTHIHFVAEGQVEFRSLLFCPKTAASDLFDTGKHTNSIKLYVKRVFIKDENLELLPRYLNFVRGVVDSNDLPLNVSREMLQQSKTLKVIRKKLVRKALEMFKHLADDEDKSKYTTFFEQFGKSIKLGLIEDSANKTKLSKLLRFQSSKTEGEDMISLDDYVARMKDEQEYIYYHADESRAKVEDSPFLERIKAKGFEVLYFLDPIDEYAAQTLTEYEGKKIVAVSKESLKVGDEDNEKMIERKKADEESYKPLMDFVKKFLSEKVEEVKITNRLSKTPAVLVTSKYGYTPSMERVVKTQALQSGQKYSGDSKRTMEINPRHPIVKNLNDKVNDAPDSDDTKDSVRSLYDSAVLMSGYQLDDPVGFATRMHKMMANSMNIAESEIEALATPEEE